MDRACASCRRSALSTSSSSTLRRSTSSGPSPSPAPARASRRSRARVSVETGSPFTTATAREAFAASREPPQRPHPRARASAAAARATLRTLLARRGSAGGRRVRRRAGRLGDHLRAAHHHGPGASAGAGHAAGRPRLDRRLGDLDRLEGLVVDGDLGRLAEALQPLVELLRLLVARELGGDLALHLVEGPVHLGLLARELEEEDARRRLDDAGGLAGLERERGVRDRLAVRLLELLLRPELEVAADLLRRRVLGDRRHLRVEGERVVLLLLGLDLLERLLRERDLLRAVGRAGRRVQDDRLDPHLAGADVLGLVVLVVLRGVRLGHVRAGVRIRLELLLDELLHHDLAQRRADVRILVEPLALGLGGEHLLADEVVEELLLPLERRVARPDEGRLLVEPGLELVGGDEDAVALGDGHARLLAAGLGLAGRGGDREKADDEETTHGEELLRLRGEGRAAEKRRRARGKKHGTTEGSSAAARPRRARPPPSPSGRSRRAPRGASGWPRGAPVLPPPPGPGWARPSRRPPPPG